GQPEGKDKELLRVCHEGRRHRQRRQTGSNLHSPQTGITGKASIGFIPMTKLKYPILLTIIMVAALILEHSLSSRIVFAGCSPPENCSNTCGSNIVSASNWKILLATRPQHRS
ncbi:MAG: hypothetical protein AAB209_10280, partial [Bacteroidota bacterium]